MPFKVVDGWKDSGETPKSASELEKALNSLGVSGSVVMETVEKSRLAREREIHYNDIIVYYEEDEKPAEDSESD